MSSYSCELTDAEFFLSKKEKEFFLRRGLDLPSRSENERLRSILSLVPQPIFGSRSLDLIQGKFNTTAFSNLALEDATYPEIGEDFFLDSFGTFKKLFLRFFTRVSLVEQVANYGNPLLYGSIKTENSFDCNFVENCKDCYELLLSSDCVNVYFSRFVSNCENSYFLENCYNCSHCLFCSNIQDQEYLVFNSKVDRETYNQILNSLSLHSPVHLEQTFERFENFLANQPVFETGGRDVYRKGFPIEDQNKGATFFSKNCRNSSSLFGCNELENSYACFGSSGSFTNCHSSSLLFGSGEEVYRSISCFGEIKNLDFCIACEDCSDLFCCFGLKNKAYCIFNKQLTKREYFRNLDSIRKIFKADGFSIALLFDQAKLFPYNHSLAEIIFPINKVQAEMMGYLWDNAKDSVKIPDSDKGGLICGITGQQFFISKIEDDFLSEKKLAAPNRSPAQRFKDRMSILSLTPKNITQCAVTGIDLCNWQSNKRAILSQKAFKKLVEGLP